MKKIRYILPLIGAWLSVGCASNEYQMYSGDAKIQFENLTDSVKSHSFYFQEAAITQDTLFFIVSTIGYTSDTERPFKVKQVEPEEGVNPVEGVHYKSFTDSDILKLCVIKPGQVSAKVPIVMLRNALDDKVTYQLRFEVEANEHFTLGESDKLWRKAVFSKGLLKPNLWNAVAERMYWGKYSYNKHEWMVAQTDEKWDDEFLESVNKDPGSAIFWRDELNRLLNEYIAAGNELLDDDKQPITKFP